MPIRDFLAERNKAVLVGAALLLLLAVLCAMIIKKPPAEAPQKPLVVEEPETQWYIRFYVQNQKTTAYVEPNLEQLASSGGGYYIGGVAVHPLKPGSDPRNPIIPFGTMIYLDEPLQVQGREMSAFKVIDTGDVAYGRYGSTPYWFDIYWGQSDYYNVQEASKFGIKTVNFYWYEPWR